MILSELSGIGMEYGAIRALVEIDYAVAPGEIVGRHRQLVGSAQPDAHDRPWALEINWQPELLISAQTWNVWALEALCSAAVT